MLPRIYSGEHLSMDIPNVMKCGPGDDYLPRTRTLRRSSTPPFLEAARLCLEASSHMTLRAGPRLRTRLGRLADIQTCATFTPTVATVIVHRNYAAPSYPRSVFDMIRDELVVRHMQINIGLTPAPPLSIPGQV
nr:hypothetical protein CFP56_11344 [Quercus suber]